MNVFKGCIIQCDENNSVAKYLVEHDGKIVFVGNILDDEYSMYPVTDLENKAIIPSFVNPYYQISKEGISVLSFSKFYLDTVNLQLTNGISFCNYILESDFLIPGTSNDFHANFSTLFSSEKKKSRRDENEVFVVDMGQIQDSNVQELEIAHKLGKQIFIHVDSDSYFDMAVSTLSKILSDSKNNEIGHTIVVDSSIHDVDFKSCGKFNIGIILKNDFLKDFYFPIGNCIRSNVLLSFALEKMPYEYLLNSILPDDESLKTSLFEIFRCLTYNSAKICHAENYVGSLEKGKFADFVILNQSPYACDKEKLSDIKIEKVFIKGNEMSVLNQSAISALISGVFKRK